MAEAARAGWAPLAGVVLLAMVPPLASLLDQPYLVSLFNRAVILAIAAIGLDLILGFGGMVSFGHAALFRLGRLRAAGVLAHHAFERIFHRCLTAGHSRLPGTEPACRLSWIVRGIVLAAADAAMVRSVMISLRTGGRLFHHDHAGVRADDLLFRDLAARRYGGEDGFSLIYLRNSFPGL